MKIMGKSVSVNQLMIIVVIAGYLLVNVTMQFDFFAGRDIFAKYQVATSAADAVVIAQKAYYAKTGFLLILLVLLAFGVPFPLGFGIAFMVYALGMLTFFGIGRPTALYLLGAAALLVSYFIPQRDQN